MRRGRDQSLAAESPPLGPRNRVGFVHMLSLIGLLAAGFWLTRAGNPWAWAGGQLLLAAAFLHAFVLLHEAGHGTLFSNRALNHLAGHLAGAIALIPFWNWQLIHLRHHRYTGWQDLDATTAALVPRPLATAERRLVD